MGVKGVGLIALLIALGFLLLSTVSTRATGSRSHRFVEVSGIRVAGSLATRVDIFLDIAPGQDQAALEQDALARESMVRERDLRQQVTAEVDAALLDLRSASAQQRIAAERLRLAEDELAQSRERFAAGVAGNIEVINAQASLIQARDADIDARFSAVVARVALARAVGVARTLH